MTCDRIVTEINKAYIEQHIITTDEAVQFVKVIIDETVDNIPLGYCGEVYKNNLDQIPQLCNIVVPKEELEKKRKEHQHNKSSKMRRLQLIYPFGRS